MVEGSWAVRYDDNTILAQFDPASPHFMVAALHPRGGEVPYRAIEWARVTELFFESDLTKTTFTVGDPGADYYIALKSRTFMLPNQGVELRCFLICTMDSRMPVDLDRIATVEAATVHVTYWFPDGSTHQCPHYNCADVGNWVQGLATGKQVGLMPATHSQIIAGSSLLA